MIDEAEYYLNDGEIQKARPLAANLASEIVFCTTNIPQALSILALMIVMWFSHQGEFRTDAGGGQAGGLKRLCMTHPLREERSAILKFSGSR